MQEILKKNTLNEKKKKGQKKIVHFQNFIYKIYKKLAFSVSYLYALNTENFILIYGKETFSHFFKLFFVFGKKSKM